MKGVVSYEAIFDVGCIFAQSDQRNPKAIVSGKPNVWT